jgi:hypothetical protein
MVLIMKTIRFFCHALILSSVFLQFAHAQSAEEQASEDSKQLELKKQEVNQQKLIQKSKTSVADQVQELKKRVVDLNRELFILEEDLLFPASTQIAVFVSIDVGHFFKLDSMKLSINGEDVTSHLYTDREISALTRGAIQRLFTGNVKTGEHEIAVYLHGFGPENRPYKLAASLMFEKDDEPVRLEVKVLDSTKNFQPKIEIVNWED